MNQQLPTAVSKAIAMSAETKRERMTAFAQAICQMRDEAVKGRTESGIELTWMECEEAYLGIDDENRAEFNGAAWAKPASIDGPLTTKRSNSSNEVRATGFVRMTSRYVDAGAAKAGEMVLPVDGKVFSMQPTPVAELTKALQDNSQVSVNGQPQMRPAQPEDAAPPAPTADEAGQPAQPPAEVPLTVADLARNQKRMVEEAGEKAEDWIRDWMVEYGHVREMRKVLFDGARLGSGILNGPVPEVSESMAVTGKGNALTLEMVSKIKPVARWVDVWDLFPDPGAGEDIHDGSYCLERFAIGKRALMKLATNPEYIAENVQAVIDQGPSKSGDNGGRNAAHEQNRKQWVGWRFYGVIESEDLALHNPGLYETKGRPQEAVFALVTMVNDLPIKVSVNPLDSGVFPYRVFNWRRRAGHWAGVGVAEQVRFPQRLVNSATRAMITNAGKSAGSVIVMDRSGIDPADGNNAMVPDKIYYKNPESVSDDVRKAFTVFQIPNVTPQIMLVVEYAFRLAEESSNIPLISQGQSGDTTPDTFGATQMQNNNANQLLRDVGYGVAESITEPLVRDLYEWMLLDPDVPDECKGDFKVDVSGSVALVEKAIQDQTIAGLGNLVMNPAFGLDPKRWAEAFLRTKRLSPVEFQYTEEESKKMASQPPPKAPAVQAAEVRAQAQVSTAQSRDQLMAKRIEVDTDRDTALVDSMRRRDDAQYEARMEELKIKRDIATLQYATQQQISLDRAKAELAKTTMQLSVQRELAGKEAAQVAPTDMEPVGRAQDGRAFEQ